MQCNNPLIIYLFMYSFHQNLTGTHNKKNKKKIGEKLFHHNEKLFYLLSRRHIPL